MTKVRFLLCLPGLVLDRFVKACYDYNMAFKSLERRKEYHRVWYAKNRTRRLTQINADRDRRRGVARVFIYEYLRHNPCTDCGERDIIVLDFDHVHGQKVANISKMINEGRPLEIIREEMAKCEVVCSNDHRRRTARRCNSYRHVSVAQAAEQLTCNEQDEVSITS